MSVNDAEKRFLPEGADFFGNRLIWRNRDVGMKLPGSVLVLTPEGEDVLKELENIVDVEPKPRKTNKAKAEPLPEIGELDDLLGGQ